MRFFIDPEEVDYYTSDWDTAEVLIVLTIAAMVVGVLIVLLEAFVI